MTGRTNIVICGYPKSGTTWLSRLVAELVGCPLRGNWGFDNALPQDVEGLDRESEFACYKSHHDYAGLPNPSANESMRLLYIVRDPRDVAISAAHHFDLPMPRLRGRLARAANRLIPKPVRRRRLAAAVLHGDAGISEWLAIPWRDHVRGYVAAGAYVVQYEKLLAAPMAVCKGILRHLDLARSDSAVRNAVRAQSFAVRKRQFRDSGDTYQDRFLRRGGSEYWRDELTATENAGFVRILGEDLRRWSYALN